MTEDSDDSFETRKGTINKGHDYEYLSIANFVLNLLLDISVQDFKIASNAEGYGAFDDIIVEVKYNDKPNEHYLIQLKHAAKAKNLTKKGLEKSQGDFSIEKYLNSYNEQVNIRNKNAKLIIFTNYRYFFEEYEIKNPSFNVKSAEGNCDPLLNAIELKKTTEVEESTKPEHGKVPQKKTDKCLRFELQDSPTSEDKQKFFENFYLYVNQPRSSYLKEIILQKFKTTFNCEDNETCEKFVQFIQDWYSDVGLRKKLTKTWVQEAIAIRLLMPHIKPIFKNALESTSEKMECLKSAIMGYTVAVFSEDQYESLRKIWITQNLETQIDRFNELIRRFFLKISYIQDVTKLTESALTLLLWLSRKIPVIVPLNAVTSKCIDFYPNNNYILLDGTFSSHFRNENNLPILRSLQDVKQNSEIYEELTTKLCCKFQGHMTNLKSLVMKCGQLENKITTNELLQMAGDQIIVIGDDEEELPSPHIERNLTNAVIDCQKFLKQMENETSKTVVVISYNNNRDFIKGPLRNLEQVKVEDYLKNNKGSDKKILVCDGECSQETFDKICKRKSASHHYFRVSKDGNLEWINSKENIEDIRPFLLQNSYITESELIKTSSNNINVICANPGMGKTVLTKSFRNKLSSEYWTTLMGPLDVMTYFKENSEKSVESFEVFLKDKAKKSPLDTDVMQQYQNTKKVAIIWDGLDEISDDNLNKVLTLIENVSVKLNYLQWITTRSHLRDKLEKRFKVFARVIQQFNQVQQEKYIRERLKGICDDSVDTITQTIKDKIKIINSNETLGIPLQAYMLTELFRQDPEKYSGLLNHLFTVADLYRHFVNEKFNLYFKEKANVCLPNDALQQILNAYKDSYVKKYEKAALKTLQDQDIKKDLNVKADNFLEKIKRDSDCFGLITKVSDNLVPSFLHNSYGEFFIASYFFKNYDKIPQLKSILFKERYTNVRFLFDLLMAGDSSVHVAVLYKNLSVLKESESCLNSKDKGGRNPLQIACTWGERYPILTSSVLVDQDNAYQIQEKPGESVKDEEGYKEMINFLINKCDLEEEDDLFKMDAFFYSDASFCFYPLIELSKIKPLDFSVLSHFNDIPSLIYYSVRFDYDHVINENTPVILTEKRSLTLLHLCADFNSEKCLEKLLQMETFRNQINNGDIYDVPPITIACKRGHYNIVKLLLDAGAEVNNIFQLIQTACNGGHHFQVVEMLLGHSDFNVDGNKRVITTSMQTACLNGYHKIVKLLADKGVDLEANTRYGSYLYIACQYGHEEVVKILIDRQANINKTNKFGFTPLHIACQSNNVNIVQLLIDHKADVNAAEETKKGNTPLHVATKIKSIELVKILTDNQADVNKTDSKGVLPLHHACQNGDTDIVQLLLNNGSDLNQGCKDDNTPLHYACENGNVEVVELLLNFGADPKKRNNKDLLPFEVAQNNDFDNICRLFQTCNM